MINVLKKTILTGLSSVKGIRMPARIVVFESDDWGSIRTPSLKAIQKLNAINKINESSPYAKFDTVEKSDDIDLLVNLLSQFRDINNSYPKITANFVTANPDFKRIRTSNFQQYYYQSFDKIYKEYYPNEKVENKIKEAINSSSFYPQFHGREHVNSDLWLEMLQSQEPLIIEAFNNGFWGVQTPNLARMNKNLQATFDRIDLFFDIEVVENIKQGLEIFNEFFGFKSKSFIPNNYIWDTKYNSILVDNGVKYLQGIKLQFFPLQENKKERKSCKRNPGRKEKGGLISMVRNGTFEPSLHYQNRMKAMDLCLADIEAAFKWRQPAIISTHRINFVSGLNIKNRDENLILFEQLIKKIQIKWPDVIFLNTEELGMLYEEILNNKILT